MYNNEARYGAVLFDSEVTHDYGWACVSGEMPVRITGTHDLPSDTVWITNLGYDAAKVSGLQGSRFRRSGYLVHELTRIWGETGLLEEDTDAPARVPLASVWDGQYTTRVGLRAGFSAWLLDRVMQISMDRVPMIAAPLSDLAGGIREVVLPSANRFFYKGQPPTEKAIEALTAANNPYQPVARSGIVTEGRFVRLSVNRVRHAQHMLSVPFPVGDWAEVNSIKLLNARPKEKIIEWLDQHPGALLRVTMRNTDPDLEELINFGGNISKNPRSGHWLTADELARLMPYCQFTIFEAVEGRILRTGGELIRDAGIDIDSISSVRQTSYPFHIWMDVLWRSVMGNPANWQRGLINPAGAFIRAADRGLNFYAAHTLRTAGLTVIGYGAGAVLAIIPEGMPAMQWVSAILSAGLMPPLIEAGTLDPQWVVDLLEGRVKAGEMTEYEAILWAAFLIGDLDMLIKTSEQSFMWKPDQNDQPE